MTGSPYLECIKGARRLGFSFLRHDGVFMGNSVEIMGVGAQSKKLQLGRCASLLVQGDPEKETVKTTPLNLKP